MKWLRLHSEARIDAKLRTLRDSEHRVWFNLLCLAGEQEERGTIESPNAALLAVEVAKGNQELLERTLDRLAELNIIQQDGGRITFVHFADRQYAKPSDQPEEVAKRVQKHRTRRRNAVKRGGNAPETPETAPETDPETDPEQSPDPTDQAPSGAAEETFRQAYYRSERGNGRVAAIVDLWKRPLSKQQRKHLGAIVKRAAGKRGADAAVAVWKAAKPAEEPVRYMEGVLKGDSGSLVSASDIAAARGGEW